MKQPTIRERLAVIEAMFTNHLKHHENIIKWYLAPTLVGIVIAIGISILKWK